METVKMHKDCRELVKNRPGGQKVIQKVIHMEKRLKGPEIKLFTKLSTFST